MTPTKAVAGQTIRASSRRTPEVASRPDPAGGAAPGGRSDTPATDVRISERRSDVARDARRRRLAIAGAIGIAAALVSSGLVLLHSSFFSARAIAVTGALHESEGAILRAGGLAGHPPLVDVSTKASEAGIAELPWVASVRIDRHWPDGLTIAVSERRAVGFVPIAGGKSALLDRYGRVLADVIAAPAGLIQVTGVGVVPAPGKTVDFDGQQVMTLAWAVPRSLRRYVVAAGATQAGELTLKLRRGGRVLFGSTSDLDAKFVALDTLITDVGNATLTAKVVDVRVPGSPVLTP